jgi:hypothetical protein
VVLIRIGKIFSAPEPMKFKNAMLRRALANASCFIPAPVENVRLFLSL